LGSETVASRKADAPRETGAKPHGEQRGRSADMVDLFKSNGTSPPTGGTILHAAGTFKIPLASRRERVLRVQRDPVNGQHVADFYEPFEIARLTTPRRPGQAERGLRRWSAVASAPCPGS
jgi:hypothetical protein